MVIAVAASSVCNATGGEGLSFWEVEHQRERVGCAGWGAGHHRCAQGLKVNVGWRGMKRLPFLVSVKGAGKVNLWHRLRRLHVRFFQQVQRLLQNGSLEVCHLDCAVRGGGGGGWGGGGEDGAGENRVGSWRQGLLAGGVGGCGRHCGGEAWEGGGDGGQGKLGLQLWWDFADGLVGSQDELQPFFLLQQISNIILQAGLLIFKLVSFLSDGKKRKVAFSGMLGWSLLALRINTFSISDGKSGGILTAWRVSVSSRLLLRHLAAACLFLSLRILLFSSSSGLICKNKRTSWDSNS